MPVAQRFDSLLLLAHGEFLWGGNVLESVTMFARAAFYFFFWFSVPGGREASV